MTESTPTALSPTTLNPARLDSSEAVSASAAMPATDRARHFAMKLACETDPADVHRAIEAGEPMLIVDCRAEGNYRKTHLPGAISLPWSKITAERVRELPDLPIVTYCWGPACNAATKGAYRLAVLGRDVREMIGGLEYWIREGYPTEGRRPVQPAHATPADWGLVT